MPAKHRWGTAAGSRNTACGSPPRATSTRPTLRSVWRGSTAAAAKPTKSWPGSRTTCSISALMLRDRVTITRTAAFACSPTRSNVWNGKSMTRTMGWNPLKSFVLRGGTDLAAGLHFACTVCRRAERAMTALAAEEAVNPHALKYINRLSDLLFVLARQANDNGGSGRSLGAGEHAKG